MAIDNSKTIAIDHLQHIVNVHWGTQKLLVEITVTVFFTRDAGAGIGFGTKGGEVKATGYESFISSGGPPSTFWVVYTPTVTFTGDRVGCFKSIAATDHVGDPFYPTHNDPLFTYGFITPLGFESDETNFDFTCKIGYDTAEKASQQKYGDPDLIGDARRQDWYRFFDTPDYDVRHGEAWVFGEGLGPGGSDTDGSDAAAKLAEVKDKQAKNLAWANNTIDRGNPADAFWDGRHGRAGVFYEYLVSTTMADFKGYWGPFYSNAGSGTPLPTIGIMPQYILEQRDAPAADSFFDSINFSFVLEVEPSVRANPNDPDSEFLPAFFLNLTGGLDAFDPATYNWQVIDIRIFNTQSVDKDTDGNFKDLEIVSLGTSCFVNDGPPVTPCQLWSITPVEQDINGLQPLNYAFVLATLPYRSSDPLGNGVEGSDLPGKVLVPYCTNAKYNLQGSFRVRVGDEMREITLSDAIAFHDLDAGPPPFPIAAAP